jgi:hypothetical protein
MSRSNAQVMLQHAFHAMHSAAFFQSNFVSADNERAPGLVGHLSSLASKSINKLGSSVAVKNTSTQFSDFAK